MRTKTKTSLRCENKITQTLFGTVFCATVLLTGGCSNDNETALPDGDGRVALQVTGGIQTRAVNNTWDAIDAIGIYMLETGTTTILQDASNRRYTTADGSSSFSATADQTIYFPVNGANVDFIAYYPQQTLTDGSMTINVGSDSQKELPKIDLMTAKVQSDESTKYNKSQPNVGFSFSHKLTKLELNIANGSGLIAENLKDLKVEITKQRTEASYTPLTETLTLNTDQTPQAVMLNTAVDGKTAEAILLPNSTDLNPIIAGRELLFTLATGEVFHYAIKDGKSFKEGDRNIYNITINRSGVTVTATIEDWNEVDNGKVDAE